MISGRKEQTCIRVRILLSEEGEIIEDGGRGRVSNKGLVPWSRLHDILVFDFAKTVVQPLLRQHQAIFEFNFPQY